MINKTKLFILPILFLSLFSIGINFANAEDNAQEQFISPKLNITEPSLEPSTQGITEGEGTYFKITNSEYFNIVLDSSEPIKLRIESIPEMVTMMIEPITSSTLFTQITISGFVPLTTYYKYEDDYHNLTEFITNENGGYSYIQDLSQPHFVFVQPRKSTKFIKDNTTGGDCYIIGNWDATTKTCTLTQDAYETIQIDNNNIILDGNGHAIVGSGTGNGVYLYGRSGVTIKNLRVQMFNYGISLRSSSNNTLTNNIASLSGWYGIYLYSSSNNTLTSNTVSSNGGGILFSYSNNNTLTSNTANSNGDGIYLSSSSGNTLISNITNSNNNNGISIFESSNNTLTSDIASLNGYRGISIYSSNNNTLINNAANSNAQYGIHLIVSNNNILTNNSVNSNGYGISLRSSSSNTLTNNIASLNTWYGIIIDSVGNNSYSNNNLSGNTMTDNKYNFFLFGNSDTEYNNNIDTSNMVGGKPIYYIKNATNQVYDSSTNAGIFYCISCNNVTIQDLTLTKNGTGVYLWKTQNLRIINNTVSSNSVGIYLLYSSNNAIYKNNFIGNSTQAYISGGSGNIFNLDLPIGGNYWSNFDTPSEGCNDLNNDNICDSPYIFSGGRDNLPWKLKDGWLLPQQPVQFFSQVQNSLVGWFNLRKTVGSQNKPSGDILKTVPNGWAVKVLKTTDENNNNIDIDSYRWYQVQDVTDSTIGWMAAKSLLDNTVYLNYDSNNQSDLQNKAEVQLDTADKRKPVILDAVNNYHTKDNSLNSLYSGGGGLDGNNNFQRFIQGSNYQKELILAVAAHESSIVNFNNEHVSFDYGHGIMQSTFIANVNNITQNTWDNRGIGSGVTIPPCTSILSNEYKKCYANSETQNKLTKPYKNYDNNPLNPIYKQYTNTLQSIYANIKDGFRVLQNKYRQKCPKDSIVVSGYTFSCQDVEKILTTWGYNGFARDKDTGLYTGNYLKYVADKLRNLSSYFAGIFYSNSDNLIEKLEIANNNKQIIKLYSPATFHIIDSAGRVTGLINDSVVEEIPNSLYEREAEGAAIFFPSDSYRYRVAGTTNGIYSFSVDYTKNGILKTFKAENIPIFIGEIHEYIIDWDVLDRGERGILLNIDYNGDGIVDQIIHSDSYLYDIEPPQITISSPSADEYILNSQLQIQFNATDNVSGIAGVVATLNNAEVINNQTVILIKSGINILKITAIDNDGNITTLIKTFNVIYNFNGFLPPIKIDGSGIYNKNRTLPVKFQLTDVNNQYISIAIAQLFVAKIQDAIVGIDEIPLSTSAADFGNLFRYDSINNQYIYNLSTDTITVGSWQLKVILDSGQVFTVIVSIK